MSEVRRSARPGGPARERQRSRALLIVPLILLAHCAWQSPGVAASLAFVSDDPPGPRRVLDAAGTEHTIDRAVLSIARVSLARCPGDVVPAPIAALLGPATARAHDPDEASLGPVDLELTADAVIGRIEPLPGRYCDVRIAVTGLALEADGGALAIGAQLARERLVRVPEQVLLAPGDLARLVLSAATTDLLARFDPRAPDPELDGVRALDAALGALAVSPE